MNGRVALDLTCLEVEPETGVERYARRLAEYLPQEAPDLEITLVIRKGSAAPVVHPSAQLVTMNSPLPRPLWRETKLPRRLRQLEIGLLHAPVAAIPMHGSFTRTATIHDVPTTGGPDGSQRFSRNRMRLLHAAGSAAALVVPSAATRDALLEERPDVASRVHVIPHGVDPDFCPQGVALDRQRYAIPDAPYVLWVGTIRRRKDPEVLIDAFTELITDRAAPDGLHLVMCGALRQPEERLRAPLERRGLGDRLIIPGYVSREDLPDLYREAELVAVPSRIEGFGLCALEAMACGRPLVVSKDAALLELVGPAARTFKTGNSGDLAGAMASILGDEDVRAKLSRAGIARAAHYSWEGSARAHADLFRKLLEG